MANDKVELSPALQEAQKRASETINMAHSLLVEGHETRKVPEQLFKHHFLDFFTKQENLDPSRNYYAEWIGVAGTAASTVDVVNPNGEVLFTVPPMMDSSIVNLANPGGKSLKELVMDADVHRNGHPGALSKFVNQAYGEKAKDLVPGHSDTTKAAAAWNKVFDFYDLNPNKKADDQKNQIKTGDDLEYD